MKLLGILNDKMKINEYCDGFICPLKGFSVSYKLQYDLDEIKNMMFSLPNKEFFVVINKPIFNSEIENLEFILEELDKMGIDGVFFYDLSIVSIYIKRRFNFMLVWNQTHMVTNYNTIQYYFEKGVHGALLSNEITFDEMLDIRKKVKSLLFVNLIYKPVMSFSRRKLLTNYYASSNMDKDDKELVVFEKINNENYVIREEVEGTSIFLNKVVNASTLIEKMISSGFEYGIIDFSCLNDDVGNECSILLQNIIKNGANNLENIKRITDIIGNYTGFLYKKTIYKVK